MLRFDFYLNYAKLPVDFIAALVWVFRLEIVLAVSKSAFGRRTPDRVVFEVGSAMGFYFAFGARLPRGAFFGRS